VVFMLDVRGLPTFIIVQLLVQDYVSRVETSSKASRISEMLKKLTFIISIYI